MHIGPERTAWPLPSLRALRRAVPVRGLRRSGEGDVNKPHPQRGRCCPTNRGPSGASDVVDGCYGASRHSTPGFAEIPSVTRPLSWPWCRHGSASSTGRCDRGQCRRCGLSASRGAFGGMVLSRSSMIARRTGPQLRSVRCSGRCSTPMSVAAHRMGAGEVPAFWDKTTPQGVHKKGATNARRQEP